MAYCTSDDIELRIGADDLARLADYDSDGVADAAAVARAIADAGAQMDSYLQQRYEVPVSPVPDVLRANAVTLSVCVLRLGRDSMTEDHQKECDRVYKWLEAVAAGKASLGIDPKPDEDTGAAGGHFDADDRVFGRDHNL